MKEAAESLTTHNYDVVSCNYGDLVRGALADAGVSLQDSVNPQTSINNTSQVAGVYTNNETGDQFIDISDELQ